MNLVAMISIDDLAERRFLDEVLPRDSSGLSLAEFESWYLERFCVKPTVQVVDRNTWNNGGYYNMYVPIVLEGGIIKRIESVH